MDPEIKKLLDEQQKTFTEFKSAVNQRDEELKKHGAAIAGTEEKIAKLNGALDEIGKKLAGFELSLKRGGSTGEQGQIDERAKKHNEAFRQYLRKCDPRALDVLAAEGVEAKSMTVGSDADGGYLVAPDTSGRIITRVFETSPIRQLATVVTTTSDAVEGMIDNDEADFEWVSETSTGSAVKTPQLGKWRIPVHEGATRPKISLKMIEDSSIDVESWLARKVADKIGRGTNSAFVTGNGVGKPRGFMTYAAGSGWGKIEQVKTGAAAALTDTGLMNLVYALKEAYRANATFVMTRLTQAAIRSLKDLEGRFIWQPGLSLAQPATLLGFPVREFADMEEVAAGKLPVAFGDFREGYLIVDRKGISVLRDPYTGKPYVEFYTRFRVGGDVVNFDAIKIQKVSA